MLLAMPQRPRPARKVISRPVRQFDLGCVLNRLNSMTPSGRKAKKGAEQWQHDKKPASPSLFCCISWTRKERSTSCKYSRVCSGACTLPSWEDGIVSTSFHSFTSLRYLINLIIFNQTDWQMLCFTAQDSSWHRCDISVSGASRATAACSLVTLIFWFAYLFALVEAVFKSYFDVGQPNTTHPPRISWTSTVSAGGWDKYSSSEGPWQWLAYLEGWMECDFGRCKTYAVCL